MFCCIPHLRAGPRSQSLASAERQPALRAALASCTVLLMTAEEAAIISGRAGAREACLHLLRGQHPLLQWVVVKLGEHGALLGMRDPATGGVTFERQGGFTVPVADTVGCGDSFAAAVRRPP